ncbi:unnamed protein product, partial [Scytosiphon promiscuus]
MGLLVLALASLKWLLFSFVFVLGIGKATARVAGWITNNACQVWLRRRPTEFSIAGAIYRLRACRIGVVEVDLLSGWLRSRGRLPCLGVVVGGLELRVEALLPGSGSGGGGDDDKEGIAMTAAKAAEAPPRDPAATVTPDSVPAVANGRSSYVSPLRTSLATSLATRVLTQCGVSVFGIRVVLERPAETDSKATEVDGHRGADRGKRPARSGGGSSSGGGRGGGGRGGGRGDTASTELFLSCVQAFATRLDRGAAGIKLVLRLEQDSEHVLLSSSLSTAGGAILDGDIALEAELTPEPTQGKRSTTGISHSVAAVRVISTSLRGVVHEGDIEAFKSWTSVFVPSRRSGVADLPLATAATAALGHGQAGGLSEGGGDSNGSEGDPRGANGREAEVEDEGGGLPLPFAYPPMLSPTFSFEVALGALRMEVAGGHGGGGNGDSKAAASPPPRGGLGRGDSDGGGDPVAFDGQGTGALRGSAPVPSAGTPAEGPAEGSAREGHREGVKRRNESFLRRRLGAPSAVVEAKDVRVGMDVVAPVGDGDRAAGGDAGATKVSASVKWSSVVLKGDGSGTTFVYGKPGGAAKSSPPDGDRKASGATPVALHGMRAFSGVWGDGSEAAGVGAKRSCLPIHLGRLSCSAEAGIGSGARAVEVAATGRLAFGRFTLSRDGLSSLLWLASLVPVPPPSPQPRLTPRTSSETNPNSFSPPANPLGDPAGLSAGSGSARPSAQRGATTVRLTIPRIGIRALPARDEGFGQPSLTLTTESLEGHLEMEDPTISVCPPPAGSQAAEETGETTTRLGENHRLRWLAVRKVSYRAGAAAKPREAGSVGGQDEARQLPGREQGGGRRGSSGSASAFSPQGEEGVLVEDGLAMEGVWAEWSPALFYLAGKSGAMVRKLPRWTPLARIDGARWSLAGRLGTTASRGHAGSSDAARGEVDAAGPPRGFPGDALRLPPVGEPTRAAACFAHRVKRAEVPEVFHFAVRDVRVEFPYQASVCPGDMEYGDVIQWLRRFRSSVAVRGMGESGAGASGEVDQGQPRGDGARPRQNPRRSNVPAPASVGGDGGAASGRLPRDRRVPWACQYVEAREFDLSLDASKNSSASSSSPSTTQQSRSGASVPRKVGHVGVSSPEAGRGDGGLFQGSGVRRKFEPSASSSRFYVSLGGTRHCPSSRKRILRVSRFAVLQMFSGDQQAAGNGDASAAAAGAARVPGSRVVDILAEGVEGNWTPATHLKIIKPVREVTLSIWKAMLHLRRAWLAPPTPRAVGDDGGCTSDSSPVVVGDRFPAWDDPAALEYWVRAWVSGGPSGPSGDTLHRLHVRDVSLRGRWPVQPRSPPPPDDQAESSSPSSPSPPPAVAAAAVAAAAAARAHRRKKAAPRALFPDVEEYGVRMSLRMREFLSESVGEHFKFVGTALDLDGDRLVSISTFNLTRTLADTSDHPVGGGGDAHAGARGVPTYHPPIEPSERRIVGSCFHELKARAMAVAAAAMAGDGGERRTDGGVGGQEQGQRLRREPHAQQPSESRDLGAGVEGGVDGVEAGADRAAGGGGGGGVGVHRAASVEEGCGGRVVLQPPWLLPLVTRPAGFLIEAEGVVVTAGHGRALGKRLDGLALQTKALVVALAEMPGRWHPLRGGPCDDFHRLFWKPPIPEEVFVPTSTRPEDKAWGTHVWFRARGVAFEIADEPLEAWFEAMQPVWSRHLEARAVWGWPVFRSSTKKTQVSTFTFLIASTVYVDVVNAKVEAGNAGHFFFVLRVANPVASVALSRHAGVSFLGDVSADMTPPSGGEALCRSLLERLDQHPPPVGTNFGVLARMGFSVRCANILASLRQFEQPLFSCERVSAGGVAMAAWARAPVSEVGLTGVKYVVIDDKAATPQRHQETTTKGAGGSGGAGGGGGRGKVAVVTRDLPPKVYLDLSVRVERPRFEVSPAHVYALADMASAAKLLLPPNLFPQVASGSRGKGKTAPGAVSPLAWWDAGRCMVHGKFDATVFGGVALLVANAYSTSQTTRLPPR